MNVRVVCRGGGMMGGVASLSRGVEILFEFSPPSDHTAAWH